MDTYCFPFITVATETILQLKESFKSKTRLDLLLTHLGWQTNISSTDLTSINNLLGLDDSFTQIVLLADDLRYQRGDVVQVAESLFTVIRNIYKAIGGFASTSPVSSITPFNQADFWPDVASNLIPLLLTNELKRTSPLAYSLLFLTGAIQEVRVTPIGAGRLPYTRIILDWDALSVFLSNPTSTLADRYGWGADRILDYQRVVQELARLATLFPVTPRLSAAPASIATSYYNDDELENRDIASLVLPFISGILPDSSGAVELGLSLTPIPATALSGQLPTGFLLAPYIHGGYQNAIALRSDLLLEFNGVFAADNAFGAEILPGGINLKTDIGSTAIGAELRLIGKPTEPIRFFGTDTSSRLELSGYSIGVAVTGTAAKPEVMVKAGTGAATGSEKLSLFIVPGEGDSFISKVFGNDPIQVDATGFITWSSRTGLGFDGAFGLRKHSTENRKIGPILLQGYTVEIATRTGEPLIANATINTRVELGPVTAIVENLGLSFRLVNNKEGKKGLLDNIDVAWGFKSPSGIGIVVDSDTIRGGGFLTVDPTAHRYTGAANLTFRDKVTLNAVGLLQTELPDGQDGYSLLLLVTAQFSPLQLGLGFTLNGVGGLVGVNRTVDIPYLRSQVRTGGFADLLFPANVLDNPGTALAAIDCAFPAAEGRYVFGIMAQIGWGSVKTATNTYSLLTLDAALLIELPAVRLALLGILRLMLPNPERPILNLRADFLGTVDFAAKKIAFDASLVDSSLLQFALTGDMAFRLYQGENPVFLLTTGGFHPAFQPPAHAELPTLRRLTLALANSRDLRIILTSYVALTSNTVQFGSRLDLFLDLPAGFSLEGFMGFDVLFQVQPFRVQAFVGAGVAIRRKGSTKLSIYLALNVTGPAPWHVVGEASFKVLGFKLKARIDRTFGRGAIAEPQRAIDVRPLFLDALEEASNWETEQPTGSTRNAVVLRATPQDPAHLLIDPSGSLVFRQKLVPLQYPLEKFSNAGVAGANQFDITSIEPVMTAGGLTADMEPVMDFFAPEQFRRMSDAQKLSAPSFQRMRSGYRLTGLDGYASGPPVGKVVAYEPIVVARSAASDQLLATDGASLQATAAKVTRVALEGDQFSQLSKNSRINRAYAPTEPAARVPQPLRWAEDTYAVVNAQDLSLYGATGGDAFANEAEATAYLQAQIASRQVQAEELLVVPAYQLAL